MRRLKEILVMSRIRTVSQICFDAGNRHGSYTGFSQSHLYRSNISNFRWISFQKTSNFHDAQNHKSKNSTLHHTVENTAAVFPLSFHETKQQNNIFSKTICSKSSISHFSMKKEPHILHHYLAPGAKFSSRSYSSNAQSKPDNFQNAIQTDYTKETTETTTDSMGSEWNDMLNDAHQSVVGAVFYLGKKAKESSDKINSYIQQIYDFHPYMEKVIVPVGGTMAATLLAWFVMPRILRKFHKYASRNPLVLLSGGLIEEIPYERSLWGALEDPARYLITFMAFYELGIIIAPSTSQYLPQAWRGAVVLSLVWFLHRWKTNVFTRAMEKPASAGLNRDKLLTLEKISSMGLLILGVIALAEACGVAVQSILTVGGIGGVATAFAARDILGNILSGISLQFSKPFSLGDNIKAGSIEGQVVEMGLTTTSLMNPEKFPVIVPNSLFSSQVIVNKSRARLRACIKSIPIQIEDLQKIQQVTEEIKAMLCSNPVVSLEKDAPFCFLSRIENSFLELTLGCNLKNMKKEELYATEQNILLQAAIIINKHGAKIGCNSIDFQGR